MYHFVYQPLEEFILQVETMARAGYLTSEQGQDLIEEAVTFVRKEVDSILGEEELYRKLTK